jgi:hypothetical protein
MILRATALAASAAALLVTAPAAQAATCNPSKSKTIADDGDARVYKDRRRHEVEACVRSSGRVIPLGLDYDDDIESFSVYRVRLAAPFVAAAITCGCRQQSRTGPIPRLVVWDLRSGEKVATVNYSNFENFTDVVLAPDGALAWIAGRDGRHEVARLLPGGEQQVLDPRAAGFDPRSLVLGGDGTLYWRRGGMVVSAPLR